MWIFTRVMYSLLKRAPAHAIGKGALIAEIQQNSNVTYRV